MTLLQDTSVSLPDWFTEYRHQQWDIIQEIVEAFATNDVVVLDAPTGSGKTIIAESVRQVLQATGLYICNNKSLQDQFLRDFPYASLIKGRDNYETLSKKRYITCGDCTWTNESKRCHWCSDKRICPYEQAKRRALQNNLAILNTAYALTECNGPGRFRGRGLVIWDEADTLEDNIMSHVSFTMSPRRVEELGVGEPSKVTKEDSWIEWVNDAFNTVSNNMPPIPQQDERDPKVIRQYNAMSRLRDGLQSLRIALPGGGWVYTGKDGRVEFKPVSVKDISRVLTWRIGQKHLLMSATVISPDQLLSELGYEGGYETLWMDSSFPVKNRPIVVRSVSSMSRKDYEIDQLCVGIRAILKQHPDERVLVHTVSYQLAADIKKDLNQYSRRDVFTYQTSATRETTLQDFKDSRGGVLLAPSMGRGIDLPDDLCRVVIVAKVPFPNLNDRQVSARLHSGREGQVWYNVRCIRELVQMTGRHVRHDEDWGVSYILDSQFERRLYPGNRGLFPGWWKEGLVWERACA